VVVISDTSNVVIRTDRGLTIAGTRLSVYDVMDHLKAGWAPHLIPNFLPLTQPQLDAVLAYIDANHAAVEAEYQAVLQASQELQAEWDKKNHDRLAEIAMIPPKPEQAELHAKLQAWKAKLGMI
jgi:uncharacterized protein (DUF433 family)